MIKCLIAIFLIIVNTQAEEEYCVRDEGYFKTQSRIRHIYSHNYEDFQLSMEGVNIFKIKLLKKVDAKITINEELDLIIYHDEYCDNRVKEIDI